MASPLDLDLDSHSPGVDTAMASSLAAEEAQRKQRRERKSAANKRAYQKRKALGAAPSPATPATLQEVDPLPLASGGDWLAKSWDVDSIGNRAKLAEDPIHGHRLRLLFDVRDRIEEKPYLLAGYLHLKDTRELKSLVFSETSLNICRNWMQVVRNNYNLPRTSRFKFSKKVDKVAFLQTIMSPDISSHDIVHALDCGVLVTNPNICLAHFALKLLDNDDMRAAFPCGADAPDGNPLQFHGYSHENWGRALFWLLFVRRQITKHFKIRARPIWTAEPVPGSSNPGTLNPQSSAVDEEDENGNDERDDDGYCHFGNNQDDTADEEDENGDDERHDDGNGHFGNNQDDTADEHGLDEEEQTPEPNTKPFLDTLTDTEVQFKLSNESLRKTPVSSASDPFYWTDPDLSRNLNLTSDETTALFKHRINVRALNLLQLSSKFEETGTIAVEAGLTKAEHMVFTIFQLGRQAKGPPTVISHATSLDILTRIGDSAQVIWDNGRLQFESSDTQKWQASSVTELEDTNPGLMIASAATIGENGTEHLIPRPKIHRINPEEKPATDEQLLGLRAMRELFLGLNNVSGPSPSLHEALNFLDLDEDDRLFDTDTGQPTHRWSYQNLSVFSWQLIGCAWIAQKMESPLRFALLADDVGLGKTYTSILGALKFNERRFQCGGQLAPTLVLCPANATSVWKDALATIDVPFKIFFGSNARVDMTSRGKVLADCGALKEFLDSLQPEHEVTGRTFIISSYETFAERTLGSTRLSASARLDTDNDEFIPSSLRKLYVSRVPGRFQVVILDEAHKIKNVSTRFHYAVKQLGARYHIALSASPMTNRVHDLIGLLDIVWDSVAESCTFDLAAKDVPTAIGVYGKVFDFLQKYPEHVNGTHDQCNAVLDPLAFDKIFKTSDSNDTHYAGKVIPVIMTLISLRRVCGSVIAGLDGVDITVGGDVPPWRMTTIELDTSVVHRRILADVETHYLQPDTAGEGSGPRSKNEISTYYNFDDPTRSIRNSLIQRHINHAVFSGGFHEFFKYGINVDAMQVQNLFSGDDLQAAYAYYHISTLNIDWVVPAEDPLAKAIFMTGAAPKVKALFKIIKLAVFERQDKLLVYADWPLEIWYLNLLLKSIGLLVGCVRAGQTSAERDDNIAKFKLPKGRDGLDILICSSRTAATSLNFQNCHHVAILDVVSTPTILQIIGRVNRIGQEFIQDIFLLTVTGTEDSRLQAQAAKKHIPMLVASMDLRLTQEDRDIFFDDPTNFNAIEIRFGSLDLNRIDPDDLDNFIRTHRAIEAHGRLLGQRHSRADPEWLTQADEELANMARQYHGGRQQVSGFRRGFETYKYNPKKGDLGGKRHADSGQDDTPSKRTRAPEESMEEDSVDEADNESLEDDVM